MAILSQKTLNHCYWFLQIIPKNFGGVWYMCLKNMYFVVWKWKYMWVKKCMKMRVILFKTENCLSGCTKHPFACLQFFSIGILLTKAWDSLLYWWLIFGFEVWRLKIHESVLLDLWLKSWKTKNHSGLARQINRVWNGR